MSPRPPHEHDDELGAALSELPVPDHGPTFWADLDHRLQGETTVHQTESGELHQPPVTQPGPADPTPDAVSLDEQRARREARRSGRRLPRSLGAAAAAVALVVAAAGTITVLNRDDDPSREVRTADRPSGTARTAPTTPDAPAEFSASYAGTDGLQGTDECPPVTADAVCRTYRLTLARDGSFRWTAADGSNDAAYDASTGRAVELVSAGPTASPSRPNAFVTTDVPAGRSEQGIFHPDPLDPMGSFVISLARAGDPRITTSTVAGRAAWHYDGPTLQDRNGGEGAPNHAVADVDQASGVLLRLQRRVDDKVVTEFSAGDVMTSDRIDRSRYQLEVPAGAKKQQYSRGFVPGSLDQAAAQAPYDLLVPEHVPDGFTLGWAPGSVSVNREVASPSGPEGANPPSKPVTSMTWRLGAQELTITLRPTDGAPEWNDPLGAEGMVPDAQPVRIELPGRPPLEGTVVVDGPLTPHLWGITGDLVVEISGDLSRDELQRVAASLRQH